jgi:hypothetical protein
MTRRAFPVALAGAVALPGFGTVDPSPVVILQAIAGARLPATLTIATDSPERMRRGVWELRTYRIDESRTTALANKFAGVFPRAGIRPLLKEADGPNLTYLIPFESLTARERAWTALNTDPAWTSARPQFQAYHFGLYRAA